jgi:hypothetical protein
MARLDMTQQHKTSFSSKHSEGNNMTEHKGIQVKSADTSILENRLRQTQPGDVVTYEELSKVLGRDVKAYCLGYLHTARHALLKESIVFDCVRKVGLRRLAAGEVVSVADSHRQKASRATRRGAEHLAYIQSDSLTDEEKKRYMVLSTQLSTMALMASSKASKKIEGIITDPSRQISTAETLKLFGG